MDLELHSEKPAACIEACGRALAALSKATPAMLESLPGIGPSLAAAIVDHRDREGDFETVEGLLAVAGIGPAKLEALRDLVIP